MRKLMRFSIVTLLLAAALSGTWERLQAQSTTITAQPDLPGFVPPADGGLGSTMTLDQAGAARKTAEQRVVRIRSAQAAGEPVPALKYQFWRHRQVLKPGSAQMHFFRALTFWLELPEEKRRQLSELSSAENWTGPPMPEVRQLLESTDNVFNELHAMGLAESLDLDHRVREIRGVQIYSFLLPDVQQARTMSRLLRLRALEQLERGDFEGAVSTIADGFRLSALIANGETLVEQLVSIAICNTMLEVADRASQTPGCPNLYWALATLPRPLANIQESTLFELQFAIRAIPLLMEAESGEYPEEVWQRKWAEAIGQIQELSGNSDVLPFALAAATVTLIEPARQRLLASGMTAEALAAMPPTRIVVLDTARELRRIADDLGKAQLLPRDLGHPLIEKQMKNFVQFVKDHRLTSGGVLLASITLPAVSQAKEAETRLLMQQHRLMTIEALRMHAATHDGQLPDSLDQLDPVPAMPDPRTGQSFGYHKQMIDGRMTIILTAEVPTTAEMHREYRLQIVP